MPSGRSQRSLRPICKGHVADEQVFEKLWPTILYDPAVFRSEIAVAEQLLFVIVMSSLEDVPTSHEPDDGHRPGHP